MVLRVFLPFDEVAPGKSGPTSFFDRWWQRWVLALLVLACLVPVFVWSEIFFPYVVPRNLLFRAAVEIAAALLLVAIVRGQYTPLLRGDYLFIGLLAFILASAISAVFSPAPNHSFFGDFERMGGVWAWFHLLLFFLTLRALKRRYFDWLLDALLLVSVLVSGYGFREHYLAAQFPHTTEVYVAATSATLGNPGLLAGYLAMCVALGCYRAATAARLNWVYAGVVAFDLTVLFYSQNRAAVVGVLSGGVVAALVYSVVAGRGARRWLIPSAAGGAVMLLGALAGAARAFPQSAFVISLPAAVRKIAVTGAAGVDFGRTIQWRAAWLGFLDRPLLGYGPENHYLAWTAHFDPRVYASGVDTFDRAHNQFLELLGTGGVLGALTFAALCVAVGYCLHAAYRTRSIPPAGLAVLIGAQVVYAGYLFFWFFDINSLMLWVVLLAVIARAGQPGGPAAEPSPAGRVLAHPFAAAGIVAALMCSLYIHAVEPLRASRALAAIQIGRGSPAQVFRSFDVAYESMAPQTSLTPIVLAGYISSLAPRFATMRADSAQGALLDRAFQRTLAAFRREIRRDPLNDRLYTHEGRLLLLAASFYGREAYHMAALQALQTAISLSPRRVQARMLLANAALLARDYSRARVVLDASIRLEPGVGEARYQLARLFIATGKEDSAVVPLFESLARGNAGSPNPYIAVSRHLERAGRHAEAARLLTLYFHTKYGKDIWGPLPMRRREVPVGDLAIAAHLPLVHLRARDTAQAMVTARGFWVVDTVRKPVVDSLARDLRAGLKEKWQGRRTLLPCQSATPADRKKHRDLAACSLFDG
ncbi:MAG: O-antigen ligase family protein [Gemmatimonadaceae bacterium]